MEGKKLHGSINLSRIPKELIFTNRNGEKCIYVDVLANRNGTDQYGNTHAVSLYNKEQRKAVYIGNLKEQTFGAPTQQAAPSAQSADEDLPF